MDVRAKQRLCYQTDFLIRSCVLAVSPHVISAVHEFFGLAGAVSKAKDALTFAADGLKEIFERIGEAKEA